MEYVIARGSAGAFPTLDWNDPGWGSAVEEQITEFANVGGEALQTNLALI